MTIYDYLDPYSLTHLKAYKHLCETGSWPSDFWQTCQENDVTFPAGWQLTIAGKLADEWVNSHLKGSHNRVLGW